MCGNAAADSNGTGPVPDDVRDRLLALLLPDVDGALSALHAAEAARDRVRRARRELNEHQMALIEARRELGRQGLSEEQIARLLRLSPGERAQAHRSTPLAT